MIALLNKDKRKSRPSADKKERRGKFFSRRSKSDEIQKEEKAKHVRAFEKDLERAKVF
jgi:hypothetical protein